MSRRRTIILLMIFSGLYTGLIALGFNIAATEALDWLKRQAWYTPARLWTAVCVMVPVGVAIAFYQFLATRNDEAPRAVISTEQLKRKRRRMIAKVRHDWIEGVLNRSLYQVARINVRLEDRPDIVNNPLTQLVQEAAKPPRTLPHCTEITTVFNAHIGGLLILGAPGSGKTTILLELARELLDLAQNEETHPIPVYFNLSSWTSIIVR